MPKCTILVGVPGSGKSTWHRIKFGEYLVEPYVVSTDKIIEVITKDHGMTYDEGFKELIGFAEKIMWRQITTYLMNGNDFIIDRTNLTAKSRAKFIQKLKLHGYEIECVVFPFPGSADLPREEWFRRLINRPGKTIPPQVLDSMVYNYEMPLESEGFSKITYIC